MPLPWEIDPQTGLPAGQGIEMMPYIPQAGQQEAAAMPMPAVGPAPMPTPLGGAMDAVVNPTPSWMPKQAAPADEAEYAQRKSAWEGILGQIQNDPNLKQVLLTVGTRLMQGKKNGQSTMGGIADAIQLGALHYNFLDSNAKAQALKERELQMKEAESGALVDSRKASTEQTRGETARSAALAPLELQAKQLALKKAQAEAKVQEAIDANDPQGTKRAQAELRKVQLEVDKLGAQIAEANAGAGEKNARKTGIEQENAARTTLNDPAATKEQVERATTVLNKGKTGAAAKKADADVIKDLYKQANPGATEEEAAQYALDASQGMKGELLRAATAIYNNPSNDAARNEAEMTLLSIMRKQAKAAKPSTGGDLAARFAADPSMKGNTLGADTPNGREVKNAAGKVIGYYK